MSCEHFEIPHNEKCQLTSRWDSGRAYVAIMGIEKRDIGVVENANENKEEKEKEKKRSRVRMRERGTFSKEDGVGLECQICLQNRE